MRKNTRSEQEHKQHALPTRTSMREVCGKIVELCHVSFLPGRNDAGGAKLLYKREVGHLLNINQVLMNEHKFCLTGSRDQDCKMVSESSPDKYNYHYVVELFGMNTLGETAYIKMTDFRPYFYVNIPHAWNKDVIMRFKTFMRAKLQQQNVKLSSIDMIVKNCNIELVFNEKLYYYQDHKQFPFLKMSFPTLSNYNTVRKIWYGGLKYVKKAPPLLYGNQYLELYESKFPPLLRSYHDTNLDPSGWCIIQNNDPIHTDLKTTHYTYEYNISYLDIHPLPECMDPIPFTTLSFDIEATSSHGDFPQPIKSYLRSSNQILDMFARTFTNKTSTSSTKNMSNKYTQLWLQCIQSVFNVPGHESNIWVDRVYNKRQLSYEDTIIMIKKLTQWPLSKLLSNNCSDENAFIIAISNQLEQKKAANVFKTATDEEVGADEEKDEGIDEGIDEEKEGKDEKDEENNDLGDEFNNIGGGNLATLFKKYVALPDHFFEDGVDYNDTLPNFLGNESIAKTVKLNYLNQILTQNCPEIQGDKCFMIGNSLCTFGCPDPISKVCFVVGTCDDVPGIEIHSVATERELLLTWAKYVQSIHPIIMTGYNVDTFDYEFLYRRAQEIEKDTQLPTIEPFLKLSAIHNEICGKKDWKQGQKFDISRSKARVNGQNIEVSLFDIPGTIHLDMLSYLRTQFGTLSSFKLDDMASYIIQDDISKICPHPEQNITELYTNNKKGLHIGDYIKISITSFSTVYWNQGAKYEVIAINSDCIIVRGIIEYKLVLDGDTKKCKWGLSKDDVDHKELQKLAVGTSADRAILAKYCIQDCNLVWYLTQKMDVWAGITAGARLHWVPIQFIVSRGQGIKLASLIYKKCHQNGMRIIDPDEQQWLWGFDGAIVLDPKTGIYRKIPVVVNDFSSLYPSINKGFNLGSDSKVWVEIYDLKGNLIKIEGDRQYDNLSGVCYITTHFNYYNYIVKKEGQKAQKTLGGTRKVRWVFSDKPRQGGQEQQQEENQGQDTKAMVPRIIGELLASRKLNKKKMAEEKDPHQKGIYKSRELCDKLSANSTYGNQGSAVSAFVDKDVAASITCIGREMILFVRSVFETIYGNRTMVCPDEWFTKFKLEPPKGPVWIQCSYVYGDTDSVFAQFKMEEKFSGKIIDGIMGLIIAIKLAQDVARLCSMFLPPPMALAYEKTFLEFILFSKKKYIGHKYDENPYKWVLSFMGLQLKRRDTCDWVKDTLGRIFEILSSGSENPLRDAIEYMDAQLHALIRGDIDKHKLLLTKSLKSHYAKPEQICQRVLADRIGNRDPGNKPKAGDRIAYLVICKNEPLPKGVKEWKMGDRIETPEYIEANHLNLDYAYYIEKQLMTPIIQLFGFLIEELCQLRGKSKEYARLRQELIKIEMSKDISDDKKKERIDKMTMQQAQSILFSPILVQIQNAKNKQTPITSFFSRG